MTRLLFALGLGLIISSTAFAQDASVSGTIKDTDSGDPIPGVNVLKVLLMVLQQIWMVNTVFR